MNTLESNVRNYCVIREFWCEAAGSNTNMQRKPSSKNGQYSFPIISSYHYKMMTVVAASRHNQDALYSYTLWTSRTDERKHITLVLCDSEAGSLILK
jgi:hypothetical protein